MPEYFCKNCYNFKTRLITRQHMGNISRYRINKAIKNQNIPSLDLAFPFNLTAYKRVTKYGECKIFYCTEHLLGRELYVDRGNFDKIACGAGPCPKYKRVYEQSSR